MPQSRLERVVPCDMLLWPDCGRPSNTFTHTFQQFLGPLENLGLLPWVIRPDASQAPKPQRGRRPKFSSMLSGCLVPKFVRGGGPGGLGPPHNGSGKTSPKREGVMAVLSNQFWWKGKLLPILGPSWALPQPWLC